MDERVYGIIDVKRTEDGRYLGLVGRIEKEKLHSLERTLHLLDVLEGRIEREDGIPPMPGEEHMDAPACHRLVSHLLTGAEFFEVYDVPGMDYRGRSYILPPHHGSLNGDRLTFCTLPSEMLLGYAQSFGWKLPYR